MVEVGGKGENLIIFFKNCVKCLCQVFLLLPPHLKDQELWDYLYLSQRCFLLFLGLSFLVSLKRIPEMRPFKVLKDEDPWIEGIIPPGSFQS